MIRVPRSASKKRTRHRQFLPAVHKILLTKAVFLWYHNQALERLTLLSSYGEMSEWLKEPVLKTGDAQVSVGSNPTLSANFISICGSTQEAEGAPLLRE